MNKKALAIAITAIMILGLIPAIVSTPVVHANTDQGTCVTYHNSPMCVFLHPGIADTWKQGWSFTLDTLWNVTTHDASQKQQIFDKYLDSAILASSSDSVGDLQFDLVVSIKVNYIIFYVPPEFKFLAPTVYESVWTDITNDNQFIYKSVANSYDPVAPGWTKIYIGYDRGFDNHVTIEPGTYHVRLFNLRAPEVAGLYHFKIYYHDGIADASGSTTHSIGAGNYPIIFVKSELNPAWVEVTVQTNTATAPPYTSGKVLAEGTTPEGRAVSGVAYWGPMEFVGNMPLSVSPTSWGANYRVYLFGLAAGTYTITATASGFSMSTSARITLDPGQSYHMWMSVDGSPNVCVTVWSKHGTGAIPWNNLWQMPFGTNNPDAAPNNAKPWRDILLDLYDANGALIGFWASNVFGSNHYVPTSRQSPAAYWGLNDKTFPATNELQGLHDEEAPHPEKTSFYACLQDNVDLLFNVRNYPSTHWDGHVPWDTADYVAGYEKAQYTVEAYVTGYIMDEADAYQRTFSIVGGNYNLQFDLRRSNWIETVMHLPAGAVLSAPTTVTLTAEDTAGNERAAIAFTATATMCSDGKIDGSDLSTVGTYKGGIVIEGYNNIFPNLYTSWSLDDKVKDYGLNPTDSTHSMGTVKLAGNPYTLKLYMADMGAPSNPSLDSHGYPLWKQTGWWTILGPDPQVSIFLCNTPQLLSFSIINAKAWISIRSVDFEVPAHSRPWIFPGSEVYVDFLDMSGSVVDSLDPMTYGLVQDPGMWIHNDDGSSGAATYQTASTHWKTTHNALTGWQIPGIAYDKLGVFTGFTFPKYGYSAGVTPFDIDYSNVPGAHEHLGVWYFGMDPVNGYAYPLSYALLPAYRSTRLPPGEYTFDVHTHGYIMRRSFPMQLGLAGSADIEADMIEGGQIRVCMDFLHEGIQTAFNGFVRAEVFNDNGDLVGASIYGQAEPNIFKRTTLPTGYGTYFAYDPAGDHMLTKGPAQAAGLGPALLLDYSNGTFPSFTSPQRAAVASYYYKTPSTTWAKWDSTDPSNANQLKHAAGDYSCFDIYGFYSYYGDAARTWAGGWPTTDGAAQSDVGLKGSVDIPGWTGSGGRLYTVKVWAFDPMGPDGLFEHTGSSDDWRMYSMAWELKDIQVPWEGAVNVFVDMNDMASLRGTVRWFDMFGNLRALPWAQISATNPDTVAYSSGNGAIGSGSSDSAGAYLMWVPAGSHDVSISTSEAPGVWSSAAPTQNAEFTVVVSDGWVGGGDAQLSGSGTPVPEVPSLALPLAMFAVIGASLWLLRKKNLNAPLLMK